jgi:hypothetical protein
MAGRRGVRGRTSSSMAMTSSARVRNMRGSMSGWKKARTSFSVRNLSWFCMVDVGARGWWQSDLMVGVSG